MSTISTGIKLPVEFMIIDKNYIFQVSISKEAYLNKGLANAAIASGKAGRQQRKDVGLSQKIGFRSTEVNPGQLLGYVLTGHTFCGLFSNFRTNDENVTYVRQDGCFTLSGKTDEFFQGSYFIGVDIDETNYQTTEDFLRTLTLKPTFWYTSFSNMQVDEDTGTSKGLRMRLIYVFDQLIKDKYYFRYCSSRLHIQIEEDSDEIIKDKCGLRCTQYFNGTYWNSESIKLEYGITNYIYTLTDIGVSVNGYLDYLYAGCEYKQLDESRSKEIEMRIRLILLHSNIINRKQTNTQVLSECNNLRHPQTCDVGIIIDPKIISDLEKRDWDSFYKKYRSLYPYIYRTEKKEWLTINNIKYQFCDDNYLELPWIPQTKKDGNHRRNILFHRGWIRRLIMPEITPTIMFYNLAVDREKFFDNSDGVLSVQFLVSKVEEIFRYPIENLINNYNSVYTFLKESSHKKKLIIHWSSKGKIKANSLVKEIRWKFLDKVYDDRMTLEENYQILNDSDFIISKDSLRRYCKDRGRVILTEVEKRYSQFVKLHIEGMSIREESAYLSERGLYLPRPTISRYRKRYQKEANHPNISPNSDDYT